MGYCNGHAKRGQMNDFHIAAWHFGRASGSAIAVCRH
jgi:hypothetical protein